MAGLAGQNDGLDEMNDAMIIAIVGAESTGKTQVAQQLSRALARHTGLSSTWVAEHLREWCDREGRTPRASEQAAIAHEQHARIDAAAAAHHVVVCDTTALMTAAYSRLLFNDDSLLRYAVQQHRRCAITLLTALDLPWVADGVQRDGPHVREPVDALVRTWLIEHRLIWSVVGGFGELRVQAAVDAVAPLLRPRVAPRSGLFTRLAERNAGAPATSWVCEKCDSPECEHALLQRQR
jgi:nicotinamide riboside kinase